MSFYNTGDYTPFQLIIYWLCYVYIYCHTPNLTSLSPLYKYLIHLQTRPLTNVSLLKLLVIAILIILNPLRSLYQHTPYFVIYIPVFNPFTMNLCALHFVFQLIYLCIVLWYTTIFNMWGIQISMKALGKTVKMLRGF